MDLSSGIAIMFRGLSRCRARIENDDWTVRLLANNSIREVVSLFSVILASCDESMQKWFP